MNSEVVQAVIWADRSHRRDVGTLSHTQGLKRLQYLPEGLRNAFGLLPGAYTRPSGSRADGSDHKLLRVR